MWWAQRARRRRARLRAARAVGRPSPGSPEERQGRKPRGCLGEETPIAARVGSIPGLQVGLVKGPGAGLLRALRPW